MAERARSRNGVELSLLESEAFGFGLGRFNVSRVTGEEPVTMDDRWSDPDHLAKKWPKNKDIKRSREFLAKQPRQAPASAHSYAPPQQWQAPWAYGGWGMPPGHPPPMPPWSPPPPYAYPAAGYPPPGPWGYPPPMTHPAHQGAAHTAHR